MNRLGFLFLFVHIALLCGCRDVLREKPNEAEVIGRWVATKIDYDVGRFLAKSGLKVRSDSKPLFELKKDGTVVVVNLPSAIGLDEAILFDGAGKWRISELGEGENQVWHLDLLLSNRGLNYTFHRNKRGLYLKEVFDLDSGAGIEFRRE